MSFRKFMKESQETIWEERPLVIKFFGKPDFNTMYELCDPSTVMFFFQNKHIMIDRGTSKNKKINWVLKDKQGFIDIIETVYRGGRKGRGLVIAPKDYFSKYRY
ncbi:hypothetical protein J5N97_009910 [Dioscorea zingiberensis]|uniref:Uncharacterized protein n=1 Tax=Dioscorea zingiberensis TaxID=325984 RepID=A0A9D5D0D5_9LILI|nr:hypothetical protein J5N97_009910 [Dioscorea zingiberensis]